MTDHNGQADGEQRDERITGVEGNGCGDGKRYCCMTAGCAPFERSAFAGNAFDHDDNDDDHQHGHHCSHVCRCTEHGKYLSVDGEKIFGQDNVAHDSGADGCNKHPSCRRVLGNFGQGVIVGRNQVYHRFHSSVEQFGKQHEQDRKGQQGEFDYSDPHKKSSQQHHNS